MSPALSFQRTAKFTLLLKGEESKCPSGNFVKGFLSQSGCMDWQNGDIQKPFLTISWQLLCSQQAEHCHS